MWVAAEAGLMDRLAVIAYSVTLRIYAAAFEADLNRLSAQLDAYHDAEVAGELAALRL